MGNTMMPSHAFLFIVEWIVAVGAGIILGLLILIVLVGFLVDAVKVFL
jgi:hypothetical protein